MSMRLVLGCLLIWLGVLGVSLVSFVSVFPSFFFASILAGLPN